MTGLEAALWGILQGLTEFLPVSSSGHLVLVPWLLNREAPGFSFDVMVHLATLLAVLIYFRAELVMLVRGVLQLIARRRLDTPEARLAWLVMISSIPAVLAGLLLESVIDRLFGSPPVAAAALLITGAILFLAERYSGARAVSQMGPKDAALIGLAQAVALIPGISRSGSTIAVGMARGLTRSEAARYAFVMSIPVVLGAAAMELLGILTGAGMPGTWGPLAIGMIAAFGSGYLAISALIRHVQRHSLRIFSVYCWVLGLVALIVFVVRAV
jgi:undecaprenyl-diphosphatase